MKAPLSLTFRPMTEVDLNIVEAIEKEASMHPWDRSHFVSSLASGYQGIIAEEEGRVVGYAMLMHVLDESHLLILTVDRPEQNKGYGKAIMTHLLTTLKAQQCSILLLEVRESNESAFGLYLNMGFSEIGHRPNYYADTSEAAIVMALDVSHY